MKPSLENCHIRQNNIPSSSSRGHFRSSSSFTSPLVPCIVAPLSLSPVTPLCAAVNLLCLSSRAGMCLNVWAKVSRHVTAAAEPRARSLHEEEDLKSSGSLIDLFHLFDSTEPLRWITARTNLSLLSIPTMTIQTGTRTMQSQPNHPKSEYKSLWRRFRTEPMI